MTDMEGEMNRRGLYIIGASGAGKSTLLLRVIDRLGLEFGGKEKFSERRVYQRGGARSFVDKFYGERLRNAAGQERGLYFGVLRDEFPGTDALARSIGPCISDWMAAGQDVPELLVGEGARLTTFPFLSSMAEHTDLLVVHLTLPDELRDQRIAERGHTAPEHHVRRTVTQSSNLAKKLIKSGVHVAEFDTTEYPIDTMAEYAALHLE